MTSLLLATVSQYAYRNEATAQGPTIMLGADVEVELRDALVSGMHCGPLDYWL